MFKEGIPILTKDRYWGKNTAEELEKALRIIDKQGWDEFYSQYKNKFDFTFEENRADWRFNIPIDKNSVILDTGAGMGRSTIPLARVAKKVVAFDTSFLRMKFLKKRAKKEGLDNIDVYVADLFDLPFKKASFDLIVMNGVLEWVGKTNLFKNPREAQIQSLKICKNLLKEGGYLYIGIENRFASAYLRGVDHGGLRYTNYMPRWMANIYTKIRMGERYTTYTYSKIGYRKLLEESGFKNSDFYLVYPGYNRPRTVLPYDDLNILEYTIKNLTSAVNWKKKVAKRIAGIRFLLWFYRSVFFSFNIITKK